MADNGSNGNNQGRVEQVTGVVIDAVFPDELPEIYSALNINIPEGEGRQELNLVCELQQHLGDDRVRAIAMDAAEGRQTRVLLRDVADELLDQDGLADAGAAEETDLAAARVRREEVDNLDAGLEDLARRREVLDVRSIAVDRPAEFRGDRFALVDRLAQQVEDAAQRLAAHRHRDRPAGVDDLDAAREAVGAVHRHGADAVIAQVLLDLADERATAVRAGLQLVSAFFGVSDDDLEGVVDLRQVAFLERRLDDDSGDLLDTADVLRAAALCLGCVSGGCQGDSSVSAEPLGPGHDFHDFCGDLRLALAVHLEGVVLDEL
jgi:hypothetical protein